MAIDGMDRGLVDCGCGHADAGWQARCRRGQRPSSSIRRDALDAADPASGPRRLPAIVWYPAKGRAVGGATYMEGDAAAVTSAGHRTDFVITVEDLHALTAQRMNVRPGATPARQSHGLSGGGVQPRFLSISRAEQRARRASGQSWLHRGVDCTSRGRCGCASGGWAHRRDQARRLEGRPEVCNGIESAGGRNGPRNGPRGAAGLC